MTLLSEIGKSLFESTPVGIDGSRGGSSAFMTKESATAEIARMKADPEIAKALYNGDTSARDRLATLQKVAYA